MSKLFCVTALLLFVSSSLSAESDKQCLLEKLQTASDELALGELRASCEKIEELEQLQEQTVEENGEASAVTERLIAEEKALDNRFEISTYRRNYLLIASYNATPNVEIWDIDHPEQDINNVEVKFQLSLKALVARGVLGGNVWAAYTQQSWWQLYAEESAPFRETNYEPELMLRWDTHMTGLGLTVRAVSLGYTHQSNGRSGEFSRSWNRVMSHALIDRGNLVILPRLWWRIPESIEDDDNPDIDDYLGTGDVTVAYKWGSQLFSATLRGNFSDSEYRNSYQLDWTFPVADRFKGYIQYYDGYGESLIDYNYRTQRIGFGVVLNDWL